MFTVFWGKNININVNLSTELILSNVYIFPLKSWVHNAKHVFNVF